MTEPWFTTIIPTRDSSKWLPALLDYYMSHGVRPILLLDARTRDSSRDVARQRDIRLIEVENFQSPEALVARSRDLVTTPWALFLNDDEAPSLGLFRRLQGPPPQSAVQSVAIPRRWAWLQPNAPLQFGRSLQWPDRAADPGADHHWSLFQPSRAHFISIWHTDGFLIDTWCRLAPDEFIIHFEWVLRTRAQRAAKIARYDAFHPGFGSFFANMYLPEDQPKGMIQYEAFDTDAYDALARSYFAAREPYVSTAWSNLKRRWAAYLGAAAAEQPGQALSRNADRERLKPDPGAEIAYAV